MSLHFMGETFDGVEHLRRFYPAYCGNDAIRAIQAGAQSPHQVELHVYRNSAAFKRAQLAAARANGKKMQPVVSTAKRVQKQRKAGSAKGGATMRRKAAA